MRKASPSQQIQGAELGLADARRVRQHGLEHRLQLAGRARDDLQHLGGRGLLLQRLGQLARARLHLVEQPHVLDRDHRLVGEGGDQLDLLVGERLEPSSASDTMTPIGLPFAQQRDAEHGAIAVHASAPRSKVYSRIGLRRRGCERLCLQARLGRRSTPGPAATG